MSSIPAFDLILRVSSNKMGVVISFSTTRSRELLKYMVGFDVTEGCLTGLKTETADPFIEFLF